MTAHIQVINAGSSDGAGEQWVDTEGGADRLEVGCEGKRQVNAYGLSTWKFGDHSGSRFWRVDPGVMFGLIYVQVEVSSGGWERPR